MSKENKFVIRNLSAKPRINEFITVTSWRLGKGGFGIVYGGRDERTQGRVAIKFTQVHESLEKEANALRAIWRRSPARDPPGVPEVIATGQVEVTDLRFDDCRRTSSNTWSFLVLTMFEMPFTSYPFLLSLEPRVVLQIGIQALAILRAVHEAGFVHDDVKPDNFMLGETSGENSYQVKLVDFGLAHSFRDEQG